jgi:iron complex transport system ATP-binding protein
VTPHADDGGTLELVGLGETLPSATATAHHRWLYRGLDLVLPRGRVTAVLGANGAGKSTLLRRLAGLDASREGEVRWCSEGHEPAALCAMPARVRARRVAYLPQHTPLADDLWVRDVVALGRIPYLGPWGRLQRDDVAAIDDAIEAMGLAALASRPMTSLSGGERQRVLVARMLAVRAPVWILDEPTTALDVAWSTELHATLRDVARAGHTVVLAMHGIDAVLEVADDVLLLGCGATGLQPSTAPAPGRVLSQAGGAHAEIPDHVFGPASLILDAAPLTRAFGVEFERATVLRPRTRRT